jgi:hypothetical protein
MRNERRYPNRRRGHIDALIVARVSVVTILL